MKYIGKYLSEEILLNRECTMHLHSTIVGVITMLMGGA